MIMPRVLNVPLLLFASLYGTQLCKLLLSSYCLQAACSLKLLLRQSCCSFAGSDNQLFLGFVHIYISKLLCGATGRSPWFRMFNHIVGSWRASLL